MSSLAEMWTSESRLERQLSASTCRISEIDQGWQSGHLVGLCADVSLGVFEARDGAVAEAAHHRHQGVEVLQLQQLLSMREREDTLTPICAW